MKAVKENKVYTITDAEKERYVGMGYDILDDSGKTIEAAHCKAIPDDKYLDAVKGKDKLKAENAKLKKKVKEFEKPSNTDEAPSAGEK